MKKKLTISLFFAFLLFTTFSFLILFHKSPTNTVVPLNDKLLLGEKVTFLFRDPQLGEAVIFRPEEKQPGFIADYVGIIVGVDSTVVPPIYSVISSSNISINAQGQGIVKPWKVTKEKITERIYFISKSAITFEKSSSLDTGITDATHKLQEYVQKIPQQNLVGIQCSDYNTRLSDDAVGKLLFYGYKNPNIAISDTEVNKIIAEIEKRPVTIDNYIKCELENGKRMVIAETSPGPGSTGVYITLIDRFGQVLKSAEMRGSGMCTLFAFEKNETAIISCSGGDGAASNRSAYSVNFLTGDSIKLFGCFAYRDDEDKYISGCDY